MSSQENNQIISTDEVLAYVLKRGHKLLTVFSTQFSTRKLLSFLEVLNHLRTHLKLDGTPDIIATAKYFKMAKSTLQGWVHNRNTYEAAADNPNIQIRKTRLLKKKNNGYYPEVDLLVKEWFKKHRALGLSVTKNDLMDWATDAFNPQRKRNDS